MRLHILSDLHMEFAPFAVPKVEADGIVLAGDVDMGRKGMKWARKQWPDTPVIHVLGNHEFYREELPTLSDRLRRLFDRADSRALQPARLSGHACAGL